MRRFMLSQLRHRAGRIVAVLAGVLVAAASFTVLTAAVRTGSAEVVGTVRSSFRSAYDILVRPAGSTTALERSRGLVRENYVSGIFGGITVEQYHRIADVPGVQVAAPIAMLGYVLQDVAVPVDLTTRSDGGRALFTFDVARTTDRGLTRFPHDQSGYVYVTDRPLRPVTGFDTSAPAVGPAEQLPGGGKVTVCPEPGSPPSVSGPFDVRARGTNDCWSRVTGLAGSGFGGLPRGHVAAFVDWPFPFLVAAIDPAAEARLTQLDGAVTTGRYLRSSDTATVNQIGSGTAVRVPVLVSSRAYQDDTDHVTIRRLSDTAARQMTRGLNPDQVHQLVTHSPGRPVLRRDVTTADAYRQLLAALSRGGASFVDTYWTAGPTRYQQAGRAALQPVPVDNPTSVWASQFQATGFVIAPIDNTETAFRRLSAHVGNTGGGSLRLPQLHAVGTFDPAALPGFNQLTRVPLQTYNPPTADPATGNTRHLLGGHDLLPNGNIAGYLQPPPLMLTTLSAASAFTDPNVFTDTTSSAPISVIRVRVAGVTGPDRVSLARIQQVATLIHQRTGLDVDITAGSSPTPITVQLPADRQGRPSLTLTENWVGKGVAVKVLSAVDRKSLALFILVFAVCALFVANAAAASTRARRSELGVLACLGWDARRLFTAVLTELIAIGAAGGVLGVASGWAIAGAGGVTPSLLLAGLAIPAAVLLSLLAGLAPACRAARANPVQAVRPAAHPRRRAHHAHGLTALAASNLARVPGRTAAAAIALAIGVAAFTMLLTVTAVFHGAVVGSLLGNAIAVQIRGVDYIAVCVIVILGSATVADVLYIGIRERAGELAALAATGWRATTLSRLIGTEGVLLGIAGGLLGAATGAALAVSFGAAAGRTLPIAAAGLTAGIISATAASVIPASLVRQIPATVLLAEE